MASKTRLGYRFAREWGQTLVNKRVNSTLPRLNDSLRMGMRVAVLSFVGWFAFGPPVAAAQPPSESVTHVVANTWQSSDFHGANPGCSIGADAVAPGGRLIMGASKKRPDPMNLVFRKSRWAIPPKTDVKVRAAFPDGSTMDFSGIGHASLIKINLSADSLPAWIHHLTASSTMQILFEGNELPWNFDLTGTSKVVDAMGDCFREHEIVGVAAPFSGVVAPQTGGAPDGSSATQPFGSPLKANTATLQAPQTPEPDPDNPSPPVASIDGYTCNDLVMARVMDQLDQQAHEKFAAITAWMTEMVLKRYPNADVAALGEAVGKWCGNAFDPANGSPRLMTPLRLVMHQVAGDLGY